MTLKNDQEQLQRQYLAVIFAFLYQFFSIYVKQIAYRIYSFKVTGYKLGLST